MVQSRSFCHMLKKLMDAVKEIHDIFWGTKGRQVEWYVAKP